MRGVEEKQPEIFSYVDMDSKIPKGHPIRPFKEMVNAILKTMDEEFNEMYADCGRPSIAPEYLLRGTVLQILYSIRSERMLMEQIDFNIMFRWFVGLGIDTPVWDHSTFTKNRNRLLESEIAHVFFNKVVERARRKRYLSNEHFTVDGTLIEAWASLKSFQKKNESGDDDKRGGDGGRNPEINFHREKRTNETHESTTDKEARLYRKSPGSEARLAYLGHVLMENRNGLAVNIAVTEANGTGEREAAKSMVYDLGGCRRITLGADKGYDTSDFVGDLREMNVTPHIAKKKIGKTIDGRTIRHKGYETSQRKRKRVEEIFGWAKTVGLLRKVKMKGKAKVAHLLAMSIAVFNLVRMRNMEIFA
jgi:transposase